MSGRVVIVVGGSSGIGLASARQFGADGDRVVLVARSAAALERAAASVREAGAADVRTVALDIRDGADVDQLVDSVVTEHGSIDVVVHTATTMAYGRLEDVPADIFRAVVDTAVHGTANLGRALVPVFRRQHRGTFVIVNSLLGAITVPSMGTYATAKWGQRALARTLQQELRDEPGVRISIVSPGSINTPIYYQAANFTGRDTRPPVPVLQPERAAAAIHSLVRRPRRHASVPVGPGSPLVVFGYRVLPALYDFLVGPLFRLAALTRARPQPTSGSVLHPAPNHERVHGHWPDRPEA